MGPLLLLYMHLHWSLLAVLWPRQSISLDSLTTFPKLPPSSLQLRITEQALPPLVFSSASQIIYEFVEDHRCLHRCLLVTHSTVNTVYFCCLVSCLLTNYLSMQWPSFEITATLRMYLVQVSSEIFLNSLSYATEILLFFSVVAINKFPHFEVVSLFWIRHKGKGYIDLFFFFTPWRV